MIETNDNYRKHVALLMPSALGEERTERPRRMGASP
jgi:hypothetical protein